MLCSLETTPLHIRSPSFGRLGEQNGARPTAPARASLSIAASGSTPPAPTVFSKTAPPSERPDTLGS